MAKEREKTYIEVTTTAVYMFDKGIDGRTDEEIADEFFRKFDLDSSHVSRDLSKIYGATRLVEAKVLTDKEMAESMAKSKNANAGLRR